MLCISIQQKCSPHRCTARIIRLGKMFHLLGDFRLQLLSYHMFVRMMLGWMFESGARMGGGIHIEASQLKYLLDDDSDDEVARVLKKKLLKRKTLETLESDVIQN